MEIDYTIISKGTERRSKKGYMGVTKPELGKRLFVLADHKDKYVKKFTDAIIMKGDVGIENVVISRFRLITYDILNKKINSKCKKRIIILGLGCVGFASVINLLHQGVKEITCFINKNEKYKYRKKILEEIMVNYDANINIISELKELEKEENIIIDTTADSKLIEKCIENTKNNTEFILIGIDDVNIMLNLAKCVRKNLSFIGYHEIIEKKHEERKKNFIKLLNEEIKIKSNKIIRRNSSLKEYKMRKEYKIYDIIKYKQNESSDKW